MKKRLLTSVCALAIAFVVTLMPGQNLVARAAEASLEQQAVSSAAIQQQVIYQTCLNIVWSVPYDENVGQQVISCLHQVPVQILQSFNDVGGQICIEDIKTVNYGMGFYNYSQYSYCAGYTSTTVRSSGEVVKSAIHIIGTVSDVEYALCHEFGHYFEADYFGRTFNYPMFVTYGGTEHQAFIRNEENGSNYTLTSPEEYFAELFSYVCKGNDVNKYQATQIMSFYIQCYINGYDSETAKQTVYSTYYANAA